MVAWFNQFFVHVYCIFYFDLYKNLYVKFNSFQIKSNKFVLKTIGLDCESKKVSNGAVVARSKFNSNWLLI